MKLRSFSGVVLVSLSDSTQTAAHGDAPVVPDTISEVRGFVRDDKYPNPLFGDFLALSGALFFAAYVILFKVRVRQESRVDMQLFFGFVGLCTMLFLWPIGLILHLTGVETFELPSDRRTIIGLLVNVGGGSVIMGNCAEAFILDVRHWAERLALCRRHVKDNAARGDRRCQPHHPYGRRG